MPLYAFLLDAKQNIVKDTSSFVTMFNTSTYNCITFFFTF